MVVAHFFPEKSPKVALIPSLPFCLDEQKLAMVTIRILSDDCLIVPFFKPQNTMEILQICHCFIKVLFLLVLTTTLL